LVESVDPGPPASIVATGLLDGGRTRLTGTGPTEDDAWRYLARAAIAWKREDGRNVRFWWGGSCGADLLRVTVSPVFGPRSGL
jgi:hypothetical protein